jgi:hypothetical protein
MKTFNQYYLNEAYYQMLDEDLDKITDYIYERFKKMFKKYENINNLDKFIEMLSKHKNKNYSDISDLFTKNNIRSFFRNEVRDSFGSLWEYNIKDKKPRLIKITPEKTYDEENFNFHLILTSEVNIRNIYGFEIDGELKDGILINLFIKSYDHFIKYEKEIKFEIKNCLIHEITHFFDFVLLNKDEEKLREIELHKVFQSKDTNSISFYLNKYRSVPEINAIIHELIYIYKRLQKENYPNLENISLFELIDKLKSFPEIVYFTIVSSPKLQEYYIRRLNREGIPIRRIRTCKYTFKELKDELGPGFRLLVPEYIIKKIKSYYKNIKKNKLYKNK